MHVLFVCTGNICRSPSAERLAMAYASRLQIPNLTASSAGTHAAIGHPIHPEAASVLDRLGIDSAGFKARQITPRMASAADLILAMTKSHRDAVLELAPHKLNRTFSLGEAARLVTEFNAQGIADLAVLRSSMGRSDQWDIPDPIGRSADVFGNTGSLIADLVRSVLRLCQTETAGPR